MIRASQRPATHVRNPKLSSGAGLGLFPYAKRIRIGQPEARASSNCSASPRRFPLARSTRHPAAIGSSSTARAALSNGTWRSIVRSEANTPVRPLYKSYRFTLSQAGVTRRRCRRSLLGIPKQKRRPLSDARSALLTFMATNSAGRGPVIFRPSSRSSPIQFARFPTERHCPGQLGRTLRCARRQFAIAASSAELQAAVTGQKPVAQAPPMPSAVNSLLAKRQTGALLKHSVHRSKSCLQTAVKGISIRYLPMFRPKTR